MYSDSKSANDASRTPGKHSKASHSLVISRKITKKICQQIIFVKSFLTKFSDLLWNVFCPLSPKHPSYICVRLADDTARIFTMIPLRGNRENRSQIFYQN